MNGGDDSRIEALGEPYFCRRKATSRLDDAKWSVVSLSQLPPRIGDLLPLQGVVRLDHVHVPRLAVAALQVRRGVEATVMHQRLPEDVLRTLDGLRLAPGLPVVGVDDETHQPGSVHAVGVKKQAAFRGQHLRVAFVGHQVKGP